jgi:uncharacterized protein
VTAVLLWFVRLIVLLLVVRLIVRGMYSVLGQRQAPKPPSRMPERAGGTLVRDPQCGTFIPESRALVVGRGADLLHFCSTTCRDAWTAAHGNARAKA